MRAYLIAGLCYVCAASSMSVTAPLAPRLTAVSARLRGMFGVRQQVRPPVELGPALTTLREEFSSLTSMRELGDGRVLLSDLSEKRLLVADFARNTVASLSRPGNGPGEFRTPGPLYALPGDSTALIDVTARRWIIIDPRLALHNTSSRLADRRGDG